MVKISIDTKRIGDTIEGIRLEKNSPYNFTNDLRKKILATLNEQSDIEKEKIEQLKNTRQSKQLTQHDIHNQIYNIDSHRISAIRLMYAGMSKLLKSIEDSFDLFHTRNGDISVILGYIEQRLYNTNETLDGQFFKKINKTEDFYNRLHKKTITTSGDLRYFMQNELFSLYGLFKDENPDRYYLSTPTHFENAKNLIYILSLIETSVSYNNYESLYTQPVLNEAFEINKLKVPDTIWGMKNVIKKDVDKSTKQFITFFMTDTQRHPKEKDIHLSPHEKGLLNKVLKNNKIGNIGELLSFDIKGGNEEVSSRWKSSDGYIRKIMDKECTPDTVYDGFGNILRIDFPLIEELLLKYKGNEDMQKILDILLKVKDEAGAKTAKYILGYVDDLVGTHDFPKERRKNFFTKKGNYSSNDYRAIHLGSPNFQWKKAKINQPHELIITWSYPNHTGRRKQQEKNHLKKKLFDDTYIDFYNGLLRYLLVAQSERHFEVSEFNDEIVHSLESKTILRIKKSEKGKDAKLLLEELSNCEPYMLRELLGNKQIDLYSESILGREIPIGKLSMKDQDYRTKHMINKFSLPFLKKYLEYTIEPLIKEIENNNPSSKNERLRIAKECKSYIQGMIKKKKNTPKNRL